VFCPSRDGNPYDASKLRKPFAKARKRAGIERKIRSRVANETEDHRFESCRARSLGGAMLLWRFGARPRRDPEVARESGWAPQNLRKQGFGPRTVIDVGACRGTPALYEAFPDAYHVLIEPQQELEPVLEELAARLGGEYVLAAVGSENGTAQLRINAEEPWRSSILEESWREDVALESREIPLRTLDSLREELGWAGPFGLKIDTEGFDHEVVAGASTLLEETQFVIAEVAVMKIFEGSIGFAEFIALMDGRGFAAYDIVDARKPRADGPVLVLDVLFARKDHFNHA
jgi:FkbM family methyltransferase